MRGVRYLILLSVVLLLAGCYKYPDYFPGLVPASNGTGVIAPLNATQPANGEATANMTPQHEEPPQELAALTTISVSEGDMVKIKLVAADPDGDALTYTFGPPLNEKGEWQTKLGDMGEYRVTITVSDGTTSVSKDITIIVKKTNKAPTITSFKPSDLIANSDEGKTIEFKVEASDPNKDALMYLWKVDDKEVSTKDLYLYDLSYDSAGQHKVTVAVSDGALEASKEWTVNVANVNRPPVIQDIDPIKVKASETVEVRPIVIDPDGDKVDVTISAPLATGTWKTGYRDAGTYTITVSASDGKDVATKTVAIDVIESNKLPVLAKINDISVNEGEIVKINVDAADPDGDALTITFSGWTDSSSYQTTYDDAYPKGCNAKGCTAIYNVRVTVSDGKESVSQDLKVSVKDVNRPPVIGDVTQG
ncbi:hypothetical protein HYU07_01620 [Candidatus Woesearchaeota archaeon]|nr:hypothetical protein [Candidatus Woesearchaeota archaeon]